LASAEELKMNWQNKMKYFIPMPFCS